jgi:hypothetical protein
MFTAGATVKGGFYFNRDKWNLVAVSGREGALPGDDGQRYLRVPVLAVLLLAPLLGGLFVAFMPFIGFALVFHHFGRVSLSGIKRAGRGLLFLVMPTWRPGEAYFAGKESATSGDKDVAKKPADGEAGQDKEPKADA